METLNEPEDLAEPPENLELSEDQLLELWSSENEQEARGNDADAVEAEYVPPEELIQLCAVDTTLFNRRFFPRAFRQDPAPFHQDMLSKLEPVENRYVDFMCFRGSAKTTLLRAFIGKRIAFGISRTILIVSAAQAHAMRSVDWLKKQVEFNAFFAQTFQLRKGKTWNAEVCEIVHGVEDCSIWVLALGITGQTRGVNLDDFRPDLIIVDDPCDEENTKTPEQRKKTADLFFGSLQNSLAPESECPDAKMVLAQTVLNPADLVSMCFQDPQWNSSKYSCFDTDGNSTWPARWSTDVLMREKRGYIRRNQLSLWMREMECRIVADELSDFRADWLQYYRAYPKSMAVYMAIDPASSDSAKADEQVIAVVGLVKGDAYLLEYSCARGQSAEDTATEFFRLKRKWRPLACGVEVVAYQKVLATFLKNEMYRKNEYLTIIELRDKRSKRDRIRQGFSGRASEGRLYIRAEHAEFIEQFTDYPNVLHDDVLDATEMAIAVAQPVDREDTSAYDDEEGVIDLANWRSAP